MTEPHTHDAPICPGCLAEAHWIDNPILGAGWETVHDDDCSWMADPDSEPYT